jgi:hypothetical protein
MPGTKKAARRPTDPSRVAETSTRTVSRDRGHWETQQVEVACGGCGKGNSWGGCESSCGGCGGCGSGCGGRGSDGGGCAAFSRTVCRRLWVPNVVTEEVPVTTYRNCTEEVPYEYSVTVCRPEERTRTVNVCTFRSEERTKSVPVTRYRDESRTRTVRQCTVAEATEVVVVAATDLCKARQHTARI